jgi:hypothetical protein
MRTYTVHEPPSPPADRIDRAEKLVFIKEGFSWIAAFFGPLWMLAHKLWWALLAYVLLSGSLQLFTKATGVDTALVMFAVNLLVGFEADTLRRWALDRKGWRMLGTVSGRNTEEAERRFFDGWLPSQPIIAPSNGARAEARRKWPIVGSLLGARG